MTFEEELESIANVSNGFKPMRNSAGKIEKNDQKMKWLNTLIAYMIPKHIRAEWSLFSYLESYQQLMKTFFYS